MKPTYFEACARPVPARLWFRGLMCSLPILSACVAFVFVSDPRPDVPVAAPLNSISSFLPTTDPSLPTVAESAVAHVSFSPPLVTAHAPSLRLLSSSPVAASVKNSHAPLSIFGRFILAAAAAPTKPHFNVCFYASNSDVTRLALAGWYAVDYYTTGAGAFDPRTLVNPADVASTSDGQIPALTRSLNLSDYTWSTMFVGDGTATASNYVRSWVLQGSQCDALVGPLMSQFSTAVTLVLNGSRTTWVDLATTATLSDKAAHPAFSRVIPTSEEAMFGTASLFRALGWADANVLCIEDPYARGVALGVARAMAAINGTLYTSRCLLSTASDGDVEAALQMIREASASRVVVIAGVPSALLRRFIEIFGAKGYDNEFMFVFVDVCFEVSIKYWELRSALCVFNAYNATDAAPYAAAFARRNTTAEMAALAALPNWSVPQPFVSTFFFYISAYVHDAALLAMRALAYRHEVGDAVSRPDSVRRMTTRGFTGSVVLDHTTGDRPHSLLQILNARGPNSTRGGVPVAFIDLDRRTHFLQPTGQPTSGNSAPAMMLLGATQSAVPSSRFPVPSSSGTSTSAIIGIAVGAVAFVVIVLSAVTFVFLFFFKSNARDNGNAPKDSTKPFAIVFTDIQASTALWARVPEQMSEAVDVHHATIRRLIARHHGYEVKTIGDSFMVAFHDAKDAVAFSMVLQEALYMTRWHDAFDVVYNSMTAPELCDCSWNGLRVRVGAHYGLGKIQQDPVTQGFDYYGTVVNTAARVEAVGHGGQTLVTAAVLEAVGGTVPGAEASDLGAQPLRGLSEPVWLHQLLPTDLADRLFPELRLAIEIDDDEIAEIESVGSDEGRSLAMSRLSRSGGKASMAQETAGPRSVDAELLHIAAKISARRSHRAAGHVGELFGNSTSVSPASRPADVGESHKSPTLAPADLDLSVNSNNGPPGLVSEPSGQNAPSDRGGETVQSITPSTSQQAFTTTPVPLSLSGRRDNNKESNRVDGDRDQQDIVLLASFLRKLLSVVPAKERQRAVAQYAKRWHAKVTTPAQIRRRRSSGAVPAAISGDKYRVELADARTLMAVVERVWLALDV